MTRLNRRSGLFEISAKVPDGFIYHQNFISEAEEHELIREIQKLHLTPFKYYQFTGKRRTVSFGWQYEFGSSEITTAPDMPAFLLPVRTRAGNFFNIDPNSLIQTSIIEYSTGSPIGWHRDIPHFGIVVGISLAAACRMRFRKYNRARSKVAREAASVFESKTLIQDNGIRSLFLPTLYGDRDLWKEKRRQAALIPTPRLK